MPRFHVPRISCVGFVSAVTQAVKGVDADPVVNVDLGNKLVFVDSTADAATLAASLAAAGYPGTPQLG